MSSASILTSVKCVESSDENVRKYVFEFNHPTLGKAIAEAVLYKYPTYNDRTVVCCSTQSGCPVGCRFCGAGDAFVRSLMGEEIVAQVDYLFQHQQITVADVKKMQIMFMSMGEPLLNIEGLGSAIPVLAKTYPQAALLISTSAPRNPFGFAAVEMLSIAYPQVGLQFSVHESTDERRNNLIPLKGKLSLAEIASEGEKWYTATGRRPFFNYCAHADNTSEDDVERLYQLFNPRIWEATVSVVCERDESIAAANQRQRELATGFMSKLLERGYSVRCFDPAGQDDIGGGCGQLWFVQSWMKENEHLTTKSVGANLPKVHTPV